MSWCWNLPDQRGLNRQGGRGWRRGLLRQYHQLRLYGRHRSYNLQHRHR